MARRRMLGMAAAVLCVSISIGALTADAATPAWRGVTGSTYQTWSFGSNANPAPPDPSNNAYGQASAAITVGLYGSGWLFTLPGLGTLSGYWDLGGPGGKITLDIPNGPTTLSYKKIWVQVTAFRDITQLPLVTIPGAELVGTQTLLFQHVPTGGDWYTVVTRWRLRPNPGQEQVQVTTDPAWGAVVDQVVVDTIAFACNPTPQDTDGDGDVDLYDWSRLQACFGGADQPWSGSASDPACSCLDSDLDDDVDLTDFNAFATCFNGPDQSPGC